MIKEKEIWLNGHRKDKLFMRRITFSKTEKLRTCLKITPPHLKFSSMRGLGLHALDSLLTFSAMEKVRAFRLEDKRNFQPLIRITNKIEIYRPDRFLKPVRSEG